jgi:hypothetical protein
MEIGGLIFKAGGSNMQHVTSLSFLFLAYSNYLSHANKAVPCGEKTASPALLKQLAKRQVTFLFPRSPLTREKEKAPMSSSHPH